MNTEKKFGFATRQIHAGHMENAAGSLCAPIYQTSPFAFSTVQQGGARCAGEEGGYIYTRLGNPTLGAVEEKLASLEGGEAAMAAASGMGAISSALWTSVVAGDEIVAVNGGPASWPTICSKSCCAPRATVRLSPSAGTGSAGSRCTAGSDSFQSWN